ncbi:unnamed protein product [Mytilus edulis]|uniref:Uncharacterized protein n=1 Tax=Mytilus edulis TaxID=6550 RepID=A0A8S3RW35_MYTED|nr:unnamed protein product [Mytilus edulis]
MTLLYSTPTCDIAMTLLYSTPTCDIAMTLLYSTPTCDIAMTLLYSTPTCDIAMTLLYSTPTCDIAMTLLYSTPTCDIAMTLLYSTPTCDIAMTLLYSTPTCDIAMTLLYSTPTCDIAMTLLYSTPTCDIAMTLLYSTPTCDIAMTLFTQHQHYGRTPLMWAAGEGHLEVVTFLVTHGSQLEATDQGRRTPLMLAAEEGHLEVDGETALHYAAEFGQIDVTKWLIDQGCSPWVKTKQTAMSKTSPEVTPDTHLQEPAAPVVEDSKIPEQIKKMDHESIAIYLNALESGSERRRDINLIIVGKKSVGKTSLVRRLFGEELQSVKSTNGIEIHRRRCRINLSNWEWNKVLDTRLVKETSINNRILQSIVKELHQDKEKPKHDILEISSSDQISTDDNKGTITKNIEHDKEPQPKMNYQFAYPEITEQSINQNF